MDVASIASSSSSFLREENPAAKDGDPEVTTVSPPRQLTDIYTLLRQALPDYTGDVDFDRDKLRRLGEGANYQVFQAVLPVVEHNADECEKAKSGSGSGKYKRSKTIAIKRLKAKIEYSYHRTDPSTPQLWLRSLIREIHVMLNMMLHPEIVGIYGAGHYISSSRESIDDGTIVPFLVVELGLHGTLASFLGIASTIYMPGLANHLRDSYLKRPYSIRKSLLVDIAKGLHALHEHGIIHTDLKPQNVLVMGSAEAGYHARIGDFGSALIIYQGSVAERFPLGRDFGGTSHYQAPEAAFSSILNFTDSQLRKLDTYSYGILLCEALTSSIFPNTEYLSIAANNIAKRLPATLEYLYQNLLDATEVEVTRITATACLGDQGTRVDNFRSILDKLSPVGAPIPESCCPTSEAFDEEVFPVSQYLGARDVVVQADLAAPRENVQQLTRAIVTQAHSAGWEWRLQAQIFNALHAQLESNAERLETNDEDAHLADLLFACGICQAHGVGTRIDYEGACDKILTAASLSHTPAVSTFHRFYDALRSSALLADGSAIRLPDISRDHMRRDLPSPTLFDSLQSLEEGSSSSYLAKAIPLSELFVWRNAIFGTFLRNHSDLKCLPDFDSELAMGDMRDRLMSAVTQVDMSHDSRQVISNIRLFILVAIVLDPRSDHLLKEVCTTAFQLGSNFSFDYCLRFPQRLNQVSPLMLACRIGSESTTRYLSNFASPAFRCDMGLIPLHFVFAFASDVMEDMVKLLSKGLETDDSYNTTERIFIPEQLCELQGNPLSFATATGSRAATLLLSKFCNFQHDWAPRIYSLLDYEVLPSGILELGLRRPISDVLFQLCTLNPAATHACPSRIQELRSTASAALKGTRHSKDSLPLLDALLDLTVANRWSHMTNLGGAYSGMLRLQAAAYLKIFTPRELSTVSVEDLIPLARLEDPIILTNWVTECERILPPTTMERFYREAFRVSLCRYNQYPRPAQCLGVLMGTKQAGTEVAEGLQIAYRCKDVTSFHRILDKSQRYGIEWRRVGSLANLCRVFVRAPIRSLPQFTRMLREYNQRNPRQRWLELADSWFGDLSLKSGSVLAEALQAREPHVLLLLFNHLSLSPRSWPAGTNIFHLACTNDRFLKVLETLLDGLEFHLVICLLREETRQGGLKPAEVAALTGSYQCLRAIYRYLERHKAVLSKADIAHFIQSMGYFRIAVQTLSRWHPSQRRRQEMAKLVKDASINTLVCFHLTIQAGYSSLASDLQGSVDLDFIIRASPPAQIEETVSHLTNSGGELEGSVSPHRHVHSRGLAVQLGWILANTSSWRNRGFLVGSAAFLAGVIFWHRRQ